MKCPHCHKDIRPTDHFCPHCGYDLRRNPPRSTTILGRMMKGYLVIMLLTIALPMAIVFYSQFFTGKSITSNFQQSNLYELGELKKSEGEEIYHFDSSNAFKKKFSNAETFIKPAQSYKKSLEKQYGKTFTATYDYSVYSNNDLYTTITCKTSLNDDTTLVIKRTYNRSKTDSIKTTITKDNCKTFKDLLQEDNKELITSVIDQPTYNKLMKAFHNKQEEFETNKKSLGHYGLGAYINDSKVSLVVYPGNKYQSQFKAQTEGNHSLTR